MIAAFGGSAYTIAAAPLLPWWAIAALAARACWCWRSGCGGGRAASLAHGGAAMLLAILVNPSLVEEKRAPLRDVAVIVVDDRRASRSATAPRRARRRWRR